VILRTVRAAASFLTRVPVGEVGEITPADFARANVLFPVVGAVIGLMEVACALALPSTIPPALTGILLVTLSAALSGALHLDGLADTFDGLGAQVGREERLQIMRDPDVGTFGATALVLVLAMKSTAIAALSDRHQLRALILAAAVARSCPVLLARLLPAARPGGLGKTLVDHVSNSHVVATVGVVVLIAALSGMPRPWIAGAAGLGMAIITGAIAHRQLGGITGDIFGASIELAETAALVASLV
jgi:adenosylcobinamide-GDP ribazoletransferase